MTINRYMTVAKLQLWSSNENSFIVWGVTTTWGIILNNPIFTKAEKLCGMHVISTALILRWRRPFKLGHATSSSNFYVPFSSHILHPNCSFPFFLSSSPSPTLTSTITQIHSSSFPFRKGQVPQGYQPNMAYQVTITLGISPHIKAGWGYPVGGKGSQSRQRFRDSTCSIS